MAPEEASQKAERQRVSEAMLTLVYESISDVIYLLAVEPDCFRFSSVNRAFFEATGLQSHQVIGKRVKDVLPPSSHKLVTGKYRQAIRKRQPLTWEEVATFPAGEKVGEVTVSPLFDESGQCTHLLGTVHDLTDLRHAEQQLRSAQKLEAIGQLAGGIAHDFNNILSVILSSCALSMAELEPDDALWADLTEIKRAGERAAELTRQLLAFSRQQLTKPEILSLNDVISDMARMIRRLVKEDVAVKMQAAHNLGMVEVDPGQIEQVLMNLIVNASDAMPSGGTLTIETGNVDLDEAYTAQHPAATPGPHVMLAVSDTGIGMHKATQDRIFEPFYTTKDKGQGTGLGLATVFGIVKQNRGNIWVYSEPGKGTTFKIYLPRTDRIAEADRTPLQPSADLEGTETILLVEDDDQVRVVTRRVLEQNGYTVVVARNGAEALSVFKKQPYAGGAVTRGPRRRHQRSGHASLPRGFNGAVTRGPRRLVQGALDNQQVSALQWGRDPGATETAEFGGEVEHEYIASMGP